MLAWVSADATVKIACGHDEARLPGRCGMGESALQGRIKVVKPRWHLSWHNISCSKFNMRHDLHVLISLGGVIEVAWLRRGDSSSVVVVK
jgi:hypothetical protein